jgi:hypothetical protein
VAGAAHARLRDLGVLARLGMTYAEANGELIGILLGRIAGRDAATSRPGDTGASETGSRRDRD